MTTKESRLAASGRPPTSAPWSSSPTRLQAFLAHAPKTEVAESRTRGSGDVLGDRLAPPPAQLVAEWASRVAC
jgi:hypothetical protein